MMLQWKSNIYIALEGGKDLPIKVKHLYELINGYNLCEYRNKYVLREFIHYGAKHLSPYTK